MKVVFKKLFQMSPIIFQTIINPISKFPTEHKEQKEILVMIDQGIWVAIRLVLFCNPMF